MHHGYHIMILFITNILLSLILGQTQYFEIKVVDEYNTPIEGAFIKHNNKFWYSDKDGLVKIDSQFVNESDNICFSHLSYKKTCSLFSSLQQEGNYRTIHLVDDSKLLTEVTISMFDTKKYVQEAIRLIPDNYLDPFEENLNLNVDISMERTDEGNEIELIQYKGILNLSLDKNDFYVSKQPEYEYVSPELKKNVFFIKPYDFLNIIPIKNHHVIRNYKRYKYPKYEFMNYKDQDAVKIYFETGKRHGYLIIDRETKAILSINYNIDATKSWIIGTMKGKGLVNTDIDKYFIEVDYVKTASGKYIFDSGRENVESQNRWKNNSLSTSYDVYLKQETGNLEIPNKKTKIKNIF